MTVSSNKLTSALEANRRLARLAISWFSVNPIQVEMILRAVHERRAKGEDADFLHALVKADILSKNQAENLRLDRAPTQDFILPTGAEVADEPRRTKLDLKCVDGGEPAQMGSYRILRRLGQGGMGAVYLAFDSIGNRQVAVKVLSAEQAPKHNILRRFQLEGQHGAMLAHTNIVRSYDMGQDQDTGLHYIVLEYIDGPTAHDLLDRTGKLQVGDALHIILDIARALENAHKNQIIHRDVKPANILLTSSGLAKLSDLGLAKRRDDSANLTHTSQGIGTPYYMPYEQAMNAKKADERSDIYALGATLFHLLTGEVPFPGETSLEIVEKKGVGLYQAAQSLNAEVPRRLEEILARMMARDPDDRYQTISDVIVDVERSQLAAAIPSFVNLDSALQDPVVVERLTSPIEATQPDIQVKQALEEKRAKDQQAWLLRYRDQRGNVCKSKATHAEIIDRLAQGTIPPTAEAARSPQGKFKPLEKWPEFQDAIPKRKKPARRPQEPPPIAPARGWSRWWLLALAGGIVGLLASVAAVYLWQAA